jgi:hypothetical protein
MRKTITSFAQFFLVFLTPSFVWSCPFCHTDRAMEVRAGIALTMGSPSLVLATASPFLILTLVVIILHCGFEKR